MNVCILFVCFFEVFCLLLERVDPNMEQIVADLRARLEQLEYLKRENAKSSVDASVAHDLQEAQACIVELRKDLAKRDNRIDHLLRALDRRDTT